MMPREHGAWALWVVPPLLGFAAAGRVLCAEGLLFMMGCLGVFLARVPLQALIAPAGGRRPGAWLAGYGALAAAGFIPLFLVYGRWGLAAFAVPVLAAMALNIHYNLSRRALSLANELVGILAALLGAPAAYYAVSGGLSARAWWLWALNALFFVGPVFHVKTAALQHRALNDAGQRRALERMARASVAFHAAAAAAGAALAVTGRVPWPAALPLAAALVKAIRRASLGPRKTDFRTLGFAEVGYTALFLILGMAAYR